MYVDNIILNGDNIIEIGRLKKTGNWVWFKRLGTNAYFLVMQIARSKVVSIFLNESMFLNFWKRHVWEQTKWTLIRVGKKVEDNGKLLEKDRYQKLVRKSINLSHIRLDVAFAISWVSLHMHSSKEI